MGESHTTSKQLVGCLQGITHVAQDEEFGRRHAIGVGGNAPLADVYFPVWKKPAQMVVGPAVAEPQLEDVPIQFRD